MLLKNILTSHTVSADVFFIALDEEMLNLLVSKYTIRSLFCGKLPRNSKSKLFTGQKFGSKLPTCPMRIQDFFSVANSRVQCHLQNSLEEISRDASLTKLSALTSIKFREEETFSEEFPVSEVLWALAGRVYERNTETRHQLDILYADVSPFNAPSRIMFAACLGHQVVCLIK